jgi:hypothetical protein
MLSLRRSSLASEIVSSIIRGNTVDGFSTHPSIFFLGDAITFSDSIVE